MSGHMEHHGRGGRTCIQNIQAQDPATHCEIDKTPTQQTPIHLYMPGALRLKNFTVRIIWSLSILRWHL